MNEKIERFIDQLFMVFELAEDRPDSVEPVLRELLEDLIYEERLRAINMMETAGNKLDRKTQMNILGGYNA